MELWELIAREQIRELVAGYAHAADRGRFDELIELFAPDGVLEIHGDVTARGRDQIQGFLTGVAKDVATTTATRLMRHYTSNLTIDVTSPTEAHGSCYFLVVTEHGVDHWGRYRDTFVGDGDTWRFAHRFVRTDGRTPDGWAAHRP